MKTIFFLSFLLIQSYALEITKQKTFTSYIVPTKQTTSFILNYASRSSNQIEKLFEKAISTVEKSTICKGGQYRIYPQYQYIQNRKIANGYNSNINFNCEFEDIELYEKLIKKIKRLRSKLTQNKISYKVSEQQIEKEKSNLEIDAYNYAKQYTKKLNNTFSKCSIKSVSFSSPHQPTLYRTMIKEEKTTTTAPIDEEVKIKLNVRYLFDCKN